MNLQVIINEVADNADDFLGDASSMIEARAAIRTFLSETYPSMHKADSEQVVAGVFAILDEEGFFDFVGKHDGWEEDDDATNE